MYLSLSLSLSTKGQGHLLSCSGQLKMKMFAVPVLQSEKVSKVNCPPQERTKIAKQSKNTFLCALFVQENSRKS